MARRSRALMSGLVVLMMGAAACGGAASEEVVENLLEQEEGVEDVTVDVDDDTVSISIESEDGDISMQMGTGDLPDGFPFPIADGCIVVGSSSWEGPDGVAMQAGIEFPSEEFDGVVAFYEQFLEDEGFEVMKTVTSTDTDSMVMLLAESSEATASVVATQSPTGGAANLSWGPGTDTS